MQKDLTKLTANATRRIVSALAKLSLKQLRARQTKVERQLEVAYETRNEPAMLNLGVMQTHLDLAVLKKEF